MSQRKSGRPQQDDSFDSSLLSQRKSGRPQQEVSFDSSLQDAVKECVRFIVCREGSKVPIKRGEIIKHLSTMCQISNSQINAVIVEATSILKRVYGYDLKKVVAKDCISYVVVLTAECASQPSTVTDDNHRRMLVAALIHIYMTGGPVKEDDMWKFLNEAGLLQENDYSGRKILTKTFTKQLYLQYNKVGEGDLARYVFEWGQRAVYEVPKLFILNKMSQAFEKSPDHWCEQYKEATTQNEI